MDDQHDCDIHHLQITPGVELVPGSYDADVLIQFVEDIIEYDGVTPEQTVRIAQIIDEYSQANTDKMTVEEIQVFYETMMVLIDKHFFHGVLTQGEKPHLKLRVDGRSHVLVAGYAMQPTKYTPSRAVLYLRHPITGARVAKRRMLTTLVHEMVHALCLVFFNYCEEVHSDEVLMQDDGHGWLWSDTYHAVLERLRAFHPVLRDLDDREDCSVPAAFIKLYYRWACGRSWIRREYDALQAPPPPNLPPGWELIPHRRIITGQAWMEHTYGDFTNFAASRVPYPQTVYRAICGAGFVMLTVAMAFIVHLVQSGRLLGE
ncbi:hypothetical protein SAMD00023353_4800070 [Rosellinia necatrix]|uniref:SprT-like domain-containing protein n=1 Tax=Rosellinia necatrix TaxID=77044 RepID=A0A1W2TQH7_ROSNE|nr:hypothetical protein SAMD00023353_4800070 [Rosellinia necatrix]